MRLLVTVIICVGLSACSATPNNSNYQGDFSSYQCRTGEGFELALMPSDKKAILRLPDIEYRLIQVPSGSGTKYILDDGSADIPNPVTLYTKGKEARLVLERAVYKNCITE